MQSRPDALAIFTPLLPRLFLIGEAFRLGIPCIGTGSFLAQMESGIPCVVEDGAEGSRLAVQHLIEMGHRKIALVQAARMRRRGSGNASAATAKRSTRPASSSTSVSSAGSRSATKKSMASSSNASSTAKLLTAVFFTNQQPVEHLAPLVNKGLRIGHDLSVIHFDQAPHCRHWLGLNATHVRIPLQEMGRRLGRLGP